VLVRLTIVVAIALILAGCKQELYGNLSQREANEMVAVLAESGVSAERQEYDGKFRVVVDAKEFAIAVKVLNAAGLPGFSYRSVEQLFPGDKMITSPFEQKARYLFALSEDLSRTISYIDGVRLARVHVVLPEVDLKGRASGKASASVLVQLKPGAQAAEVIPFVKSVVTTGVPNIQLSDINVIATHWPTAVGSPGVGP